MAATSRPLATQAGFSYVEMLIATVIVLASVGPAVDALRQAQLAAEVRAQETELHYRLLARVEHVLAESFVSLLDAAAAAGDAELPTSYSDPVGQPGRIVVYLSFYDLANDDRDDDYFTIADEDDDDDKNPYTGSGANIDMLWLQAQIEGTAHSSEALTRNAP